ncbi:hypothetical protein ACJX0J_023356, partial [Zea mays]
LAILQDQIIIDTAVPAVSFLFSMMIYAAPACLRQKKNKIVPQHSSDIIFGAESCFHQL